MSSENKSFSTVLAIAACALSLAAKAADNEWQVSSGEGASTEWSNPLNWSLDLGNAANELRFATGTGVANQNVVVTFAQAYTYGNKIKFENDQAINGEGMVTFRGLSDEAGVTAVDGTSGKDVYVGWSGNGRPGMLTLERGTFGAGNQFELRRGSLRVEAGATLTSGGQFYVSGKDNSVDGDLVLDGGTIRSGGHFYLGHAANGTFTMNSGTLNVGDQFFIGNGGSSKGVFVMKNGNVTVNSYTCVGYEQGIGEFTLEGGSYSQSNEKFIVGQGKNAGKSGVCTVKGGTLTVPQLWLSENSTPGTLNVNGGSIKCSSWCRVGIGGSSSATISMTDGEFDTDGEFILGCGNGSQASMTLSGGVFTPQKFWVGSRYGSNSIKFGTSNASFTMTGGSLATDDSQDIVIGGKDGASGIFNMEGGEVHCGNTFHIAWHGSGTLNMSGGDIYVLSGKNLYFAENGTSATMNLTGGTFHIDNIVMGSGDATRAINVNGGSFAPVTDKADWLSGVTISVGANGIGFDTDGHATTFAGALVNADGVTGNVPLMKKGTGTLTVPLDLDLARTFKFVIDGGVGPIALTGSNTLGEGSKISIELSASRAETGTPHVLMTGLDVNYTLADNFAAMPTGDDFYTYSWNLSGGTLSVTLGNTAKAAVSARWDAANAKWAYYDSNDAILGDDAIITESTVYYGTGSIGSDCDWSDHEVIIPASGVLDLNGHNLSLGTYRAEAGAVITNSKAADGETSNLSVLTLGANGGVMYGNANVKFTGNLKVSLSGAVDATDFGTSLVHEHTGGWLFEDNNKSIKFSPDCMGPGPLVLNGNGGFVPNAPGKQNTGNIELYVYGAGNVVKSNRNIEWNGFFKNARWHGDGEIIIDIDAAGNANTNNGYGIPEFGANPNADFADFRGTLKIKTNNSNSLGLFLWTEQAQTKSMASGRIVLGERGVLYHRHGKSWFSIGDLSTEGSEYDAGKKISVFTAWGASGTANWEVGALNLDSTFAGQIANSGTTNIRKVGDGTWTLNAECYNKGTFEVNGGNLRFMRNAGNANLAFKVNDGGTLSGTGTIAGTVTVANGGTVAPGAAQAGTLTAGAVSFKSGSKLRIVPGSALALSGTGETDVSALSVEISDDSLLDSGVDTYTILTTAGTLTGVPSFANGSASYTDASGKRWKLVVLDNNTVVIVRNNVGFMIIVQ